MPKSTLSLLSLFDETTLDIEKHCFLNDCLTNLFNLSDMTLGIWSSRLGDLTECGDTHTYTLFCPRLNIVFIIIIT